MSQLAFRAVVSNSDSFSCSVVGRVFGRAKDFKSGSSRSPDYCSE